jgi:hypothetical protein
MRRNLDARRATPLSRVHPITAIDDDGEAERAALIASGRAQPDDVLVFLVPLRPTGREAA